MVDNTDNFFGVAPDQGLEPPEPKDTVTLFDAATLKSASAAASSYWYPAMRHGKSPFASSDYQVYRNVQDFGAKGDGVTDDTEAINNAASSGARCGPNCGSTTITPAVVYFPPGTYMISSPIIQYYYTQFVGDPTSLPTIKGMKSFSGIALIDTDVYFPGGNGAEWFVNQNQFYRQIRNFNIDLTAMPNSNTQGDQTYVPTGIHWQVAQSTSLQNIHVTMPQGGGTTAVGVFTENGSGGFMSDLTFFGGNIGMRVGSQQFTARDITFTSCSIAVSMIWHHHALTFSDRDWGWTWKNIKVVSAFIAFQLTNFGGTDNQGTGSLTLLDSHFIDVPFGIPLSTSFSPSIVLDNLLVEGNSPQIVFIDGTTNNLLTGTSGESMVVQSWATGARYTSPSDTGSKATGNITPAPKKPTSLLDASGNWFVRSKPQYEGMSASAFLNVLDRGVTGDGSTDDGPALNSALSQCSSSICFIPFGIYRTSITLQIPPNAKIVGEAWPQIQGFGSLFSDLNNTAPVVQVGQPGDTGTVEISDVLFTTSGPTAGAVVVEWNIKASSQGAAAMWDSHFRLGGALGTAIDNSNCNASPDLSGDCIGASLLLHVTPEASGYFENCWVWTADHYLDDSSQQQLNSITGRGLLVDKSQGPNWFWGGAVEHSVLYQYNVQGASNTFFAHMQTETPYFQPAIPASGIFPTNFNGDPDFGDCNGGDPRCLMAWALYIANSTNIFVYGAGFYSFFNTYSQDCVTTESCQQALIRTDFSQGIWLYSLFTKAAVNPILPLGAVAPVVQKDVQNGFTTEISVWLALAETGANLGGIVVSADQSSPNGARLDPQLQSACGNVQPGGTLVLTPQCIDAINNLPDSSSANSNGGPANCQEPCDLFRKITDTCCGKNGTIGFTVQFPPNSNDSIWSPVILPKGLKPPGPISVPGADPTGNPTTFPIPTPIPFPIIFPPGIFPLGGSLPFDIPEDTDLPDDDEFGIQFVVALNEIVDDEPATTIPPPPPTPTTTSMAPPPPPPPPSPQPTNWGAICGGPFDSNHQPNCDDNCDAIDDGEVCPEFCCAVCPVVVGIDC
ncbi:pectate lyase superfamily protein-domain-containing protein [Xylogone sp. PMI_703]|nr:pectate lyase superfamily protein-domain-containing protein [Xylogone sp. PMI_703]